MGLGGYSHTHRILFTGLPGGRLPLSCGSKLEQVWAPLGPINFWFSVPLFSYSVVAHDWPFTYPRTESPTNRGRVLIANCQPWAFSSGHWEVSTALRSLPLERCCLTKRFAVMFLQKADNSQLLRGYVCFCLCSFGFLAYLSKGLK